MNVLLPAHIEIGLRQNMASGLEIFHERIKFRCQICSDIIDHKTLYQLLLYYKY